MMYYQHAESDPYASRAFVPLTNCPSQQMGHDCSCAFSKRPLQYSGTKGDRFIPCRTASGAKPTGGLDCSPMDISISDSDSETSYNSKCAECAYKALIQENYNMSCMQDSRVLHFGKQYLLM